MHDPTGGPAPARTCELLPHPARRWRAARLTAWMLALGLAACEALPTAVGSHRSIDEAPAPVREAMDRINRHRSRVGCGALHWHGRSAVVAEDFSKRMNDEAFFGHVDPGGGTLKSRLDRAAVTGYRAAAETIAAGQQAAAKVVDDWLQSPEHGAILADCQYTHAGVGVYSGDGPYRTYWTAVFLAVQ